VQHSHIFNDVYISVLRLWLNTCSNHVNILNFTILAWNKRTYYTETGEIYWNALICSDFNNFFYDLYWHPWKDLDAVQLNYLNTLDSGLHHTISLMYVGVRHLGFGITLHIVMSLSMYRMLYMLYFARSPVRRNWPSSSDCAWFKMFRLVRNRRTAFVGFRKNFSVGVLG